MAIIIPSKSTYNRQNPKIMDNAIDGIEIPAVNVVYTKEENTTVYSKKINISGGSFENETREGNFKSEYYLGKNHFAYVAFTDLKKATFTIRIPRNENNKYITYLEWFRKESGEYEINQSVQGIKRTGTIEATYSVQRASQNILTTKSITYNEKEAILQSFTIPQNGQYTYDYGGSNLKVTAEISFGENGNLGSSTPKVENDYYEFYLEVYVGYKVLKYGDSYSLNATQETAEFTTNGTYEEYEPQQVEFSFYGGTVGIDLKDQVLYINNGVSTPKKTHKFDGNELMQTDNYFVKKTQIGGYSLTETSVENEYSVSLSKTYEQDIFVDYYQSSVLKTIVIPKGKTQNTFICPVEPKINEVYYSTVYNDIEYKYGQTLKEYEKGKETATIRCSIADYYEADKDGLFPTNNKVISIDNSTGRMLFKEYDEVIPMVYGADGKDHPMSYYKDGTPKKFKILGVKPYYNGASWQELYLQEILR